MIRVLFCGSRKLGIECLKQLINTPEVAVVGAIVPPKNQKVWWRDVIDEEEVKKLKVPLLNWEQAKKIDNIDLVFSILHGPIFKKEFIQKIKYGILNLHPAPLPSYRGSNGPAFAIINEEKYFGATLHYIDEGIDTGPIVAKSKIRILPHDTGYSLYKRTHKSALTLFKTQLPKIIKSAKKKKRVPTFKQDEKQARYYNRRSLENKQVDPALSFRKMYNYVRALQFPPFEPAYLVCSGGEKIYLNTKRDNIVILSHK